MKPLAVEGLTAVRAGHVLLDQVRFEVRTGQVTGIISDNPERLNLLLNILGGVEKEQSGRVLSNGKPWSAAQRLRGVGVAREQVALVDSLSVLDNLFLSNSKLFTRFGFILRRPRRSRAKAVLRDLGCQVPLELPVHKVEPGTKVLVDMARVIVQEPAHFVFHGVTRAMSLHQYEAFQGLVRAWKNAGKGLVITPINAEDVRHLIDRLYFLQGTQLFEVEGSQNLSDEQLHDFFLGNAKTRFQTAVDPIHRAKQLIEAQTGAEVIDFQALADTLAMSYDNFRRRFKNQLGVSPHQYFLSAKVERAKELLLYTDLEVKDVAAQLGFSDPYYFSRVFKERTTLSPQHFRHGQHGEENV